MSRDRSFEFALLAKMLPDTEEGWFEVWRALSVEQATALIRSGDKLVAPWVQETKVSWTRMGLGSGKAVALVQKFPHGSFYWQTLALRGDVGSLDAAMQAAALRGDVGSLDAAMQAANAVLRERGYVLIGPSSFQPGG